MLVSLAHAVLKRVGSLFLTVTILLVLIAILLWGTVVEKNYGATAAKFGIYGSWWFNALGLILALNSAAALILRWPWRLQQLGFVIPHIGLIVLLVGCFLSRRYGMEATLSVFEGDSSDLAYKGSAQHVELDGQQQFRLRVIPADGQEKPGEPIVVPFTSGPFNWEDYHNGTLGIVPWSLAHRDQGVLYNRDGIRLEVIDYLSNSEIVALPSLAVHATPLGPDGGELSELAEVFRFSVKAEVGPHSAGHSFGLGSEQTLAAGQRIGFWMVGSAEETAAFRRSGPTVRRESAADATPSVGPPRIDFFQAADQQLYLRTWRAGKVQIRGPLKMNESGGRIMAFRDTPDAIVLRFGDFQPAERPGFSARAVSFDKSEDRPHLRQAQVRLTVDDQSAEFWMPCSSPDRLESLALAIPKKLLQRSVAGKARRVELSFVPESFHLGYTICLNKAWRKLDPGTRQASFYGSEIDLLPNEYATRSSAPDSKSPPKYENLLVTLNAPLDFADPASPGRSYRMFQSTMNGPFNPEEVGMKLGESAYCSGFTLNYDPGRGLTYVGCLLVVAGIFVAYFVRLVKNL